MNSKRFNVGRIIGLTLGGVLLAGLFALVFGYLIMVLWNWLMPALFHLPTIGYWQAFGIVILAKLIFGSFGPHGHDHRFPRSFRPKDWKWAPEEDEWTPKGSYRNWRYYDRFWREEGRAAFEAYVDRLEKEKQTEPGRQE